MSKVAIDGDVYARLAAWCRAFGVSVASIAEELLADLPDVERHPKPTRPSQAVTPLPERVIPHTELVRRLATDREANALGDAGGLVPVAVTSSVSSLVGPAQGTREVCHVHGWVGRHRFEADNHAACDPVGDPCSVCGGVGWRTTGALGCKHCGGTGVESAEALEDDSETEVERDDDVVRAAVPQREIVNGAVVRRRREDPRPETEAPKNITRQDLAEYQAELDALGPFEMPDRPRTRAECPTERPCPWVSCRYHLYLDITDAGSIKYNFPDLEPEELPHSCALDAADLGPHTLDAIGEKTNVTRGRIRQLETRALQLLRSLGVVKRLRRDAQDVAVPGSNLPSEAA